jgi:hypothetical protein
LNTESKDSLTESGNWQVKWYWTCVLPILPQTPHGLVVLGQQQIMPNISK